VRAERSNGTASREDEGLSRNRKNATKVGGSKTTSPCMWDHESLEKPLTNWITDDTWRKKRQTPHENQKIRPNLRQGLGALIKKRRHGKNTHLRAEERPLDCDHYASKCSQTGKAASFHQRQKASIRVRSKTRQKESGFSNEEWGKKDRRSKLALGADAQEGLLDGLSNGKPLHRKSLLS